LTANRGDWIQVASGELFYPLSPSADEVTIQDIAHALSMKCRYSGHCLKFYSVAEHSVYVSQHVPEEYALWGLLHDAAEAYSADIPRPLKRNLKEWGVIEERIQNAVCDRFGLDRKEPDVVKLVDTQMLLKEKDALLAPCATPWDTSYIIPSNFEVTIQALAPDQAKQFFLDRFKELTID
jgi:5'-deoxynucleotidase YfbR-like HD superfamily hydrolase